MVAGGVTSEQLLLTSAHPKLQTVHVTLSIHRVQLPGHLSHVPLLVLGSNQYPGIHTVHVALLAVQLWHNVLAQLPVAPMFPSVLLVPLVVVFVTLVVFPVQLPPTRVHPTSQTEHVTLLAHELQLAGHA